MPILPSQRANVLSLDGSDLGVKVKFREGEKPEYLEKKPPGAEPGNPSPVVELGGATDDHNANLTPK